MTDTQQIRERLRELERAFVAFEKGQRNRLFESRDSLTGLTEVIEASDWNVLGPICEITSRVLGLVLMEGGLDEGQSVQVVRELLGYVEANIFQRDPGALPGAATPGGVFHVVNSERVGDMLIKQGKIAPEQLEKALLLQRVSKGKRVGQVLIAMNAIDQRTLDSVLEHQKNETRREETRRSSNFGQQGGPQHGSGLPPAPFAAPGVRNDDGPARH